MLTITKQFRGIPIAHRQPNHEGHCRYLHGHDWHIEVEIGCTQLDPKTGFIFDYGDFKDFRNGTLKALDHATLYPIDAEGQATDQALYQLLMAGLIKAYLIPDASCEGLTQHLADVLQTYVQEKTDGRAFILRVTVWEGDSNSSTYYVEPPRDVL